jgi:hypothetical protein
MAKTYKIRNKKKKITKKRKKIQKKERKTMKRKTMKRKTMKRKTMKRKTMKRKTLGGSPEDALPFIIEKKLEEKGLQDVLPLIMKHISRKSVKDAIFEEEIRERTETANKKIKHYEEEILSKKIELDSITRKTVTRLQRKNKTQHIDNKKIEKLENEIKDLKDKKSGNKYRIERKFADTPKDQDKYI